MNDRITQVISAAAIALGVAATGWFIGQGFVRARTQDRAVVVKGIAEREARADVAIWPLGISAADDDLSKAQGKIQSSAREITAFLARHDLAAATVTVQGYSVSDARTNQYQGGAQTGGRYVIRQTLVVRATAPEKVRSAAEKVGELVSAGVVLSSGGEYGAAGPTYVFTGLNKLKPSMIAEATARAREGAEQFAKDSGSKVGGIRRASQGVFEILPRDQAPGMTEGSQIDKTVRVVSSVEYALEH